MAIGDGVVVGRPQRILNNGPDDRRLIIALLAEGFRYEQLREFRRMGRDFVRRLRNEPWYRDRSLGLSPYPGKAINVYRLDIASEDAGIDDPVEAGGTGASRATFFDATHAPLGVSSSGLGVIRRPRRVIGGNDILILDTLNERLPQFDVAVIVCNTTELGGSTSLLTRTTYITRHEIWPDNIMHELGHLLFGLGDEYEYLVSCAQDNVDQEHAPPGEPRFPNVTATTDPASLKWADLVEPGVPIPTMENPDCSHCDERLNPLDVQSEQDLARLRRNARLRRRRERDRRWLFVPEEADPDDTKVGLFEGANYFKCGNYRPAYRCKMRDQRRPYCGVCLREVLNVLRGFLET